MDGHVRVKTISLKDGGCTSGGNGRFSSLIRRKSSCVPWVP